MLFSEPKIPHDAQRIEAVSVAGRFQCSSASRKFLSHRHLQSAEPRVRFSALQRAENSSYARTPAVAASVAGFSALQRAENSSGACCDLRVAEIPFQCSSASRKFLNLRHHAGTRKRWVSVLFSEPKIPQSLILADLSYYAWFQCSSASRKFLTSLTSQYARPAGVSVLFSEPKIPQSRPSHLRPSIFPTAMITLRHS